MLNLMRHPIKPKHGTMYDSRVRPPSPASLKVAVIEPGEPENRGSMGCRYVMNALESAGYRPTYLEPENHVHECDVELVSIHHCTDFPKLKALPKRAKIRIVGGHPSTNNIRPAIPFGDVFCIGEGEEWVVRAIDMIANRAKAVDLACLPGTIVREIWEQGSPIPSTNTVEPLPRHPPYLNRAGEGHSPTWYLEMARGCPFACQYCELGWAWKYRPQDTEFLLDSIDSIDAKKSRKISLFAPDEASHPGYADCLRRIHDRGLITSFGSMRLDVIVKQNLPIKPNMLIRVGLDGLTESTRFRVKKPLRDDAVWEYFRFMTANNHRNFKVFMVFGYPWETADDFDQFEWLLDRILRLPVTANTHLRIKFTPFIPQPSTPLGDSPPNYDHETVFRIKRWFDRVKRPWHEPGWFVANDGLMSQRSHDLQCRLTLGDESLLLDDSESWRECETLKGYDVFA